MYVAANAELASGRTTPKGIINSIRILLSGYSTRGSLSSSQLILEVNNMIINYNQVLKNLFDCQNGEYYRISNYFKEYLEKVCDWRLGQEMVCLIADGACRGNGRADSTGGWGAILIDGKTGMARLGSGTLPGATNNTAEIWAIQQALRLINQRVAHLTIVSDSKYAIGAINGVNRRKANRELIEDTERIIHQKASVLDYIFLPGHMGWEPNELVNYLAQEKAGSLH